MFRTIFIVICLILLYRLEGWGILVDQIVLRVNNDAISLSEYQLNKEQFQKIYPGISREEILESLITERLIIQLAQEHGISISDEEINKEIQLFLQNSSSRLDEKMLQVFYTDGVLNEEMLRREIRKSKTQEKLLIYIVSNHYIQMPVLDEMQRYYHEHKELFYEAEKIQLAHILLRVNEDDIEMLQLKERLAERLVRLLKEEREDFQSLAKRYSEDLESKNRGGLLGWFDRDTLAKLSKIYYEQAFQMGIHETSSLLYTDKGFSIICILNKKPAQQRTFSESLNLIQQNIIHQRALEQLNFMLKVKQARSHISY